MSATDRCPRDCSRLDAMECDVAALCDEVANERRGEDVSTLGVVGDNESEQPAAVGTRHPGPVRRSAAVVVAVVVREADAVER
jgi:hypothetical protein